MIRLTAVANGCGGSVSIVCVWMTHGAGVFTKILLEVAVCYRTQFVSVLIIVYKTEHVVHRILHITARETMGNNVKSH